MSYSRHDSSCKFLYNVKICTIKKNRIQSYKVFRVDKKNSSAYRKSNGITYLDFCIFVYTEDSTFVHARLFVYSRLV